MESFESMISAPLHISQKEVSYDRISKVNWLTNKNKVLPILLVDFVEKYLNRCFRDIANFLYQKDIITLHDLPIKTDIVIIVLQITRGGGLH